MHQPPPSNPNAPVTGPSISTERPSTTTTAGDSAAAYEAAQSILKAINFGGLLKLPPDEDEPKNEGLSQPPHNVGNGVEHLLSHVQAVLASRNSEVEEETLPVLPSSSSQVPENKRAELQAQLALLSAQLAGLAQIEESQVRIGQTATVLPEPPMHSLTPDVPQPLETVSTNAPTTSSVTTVSPTMDHASTDRPAVVAASAEEAESDDDDDMEAVI
jgi:hypothetical protein